MAAPLPNPCSECGSAMRSRAAHIPGTLTRRHIGQGLCQACWTRRHRKPRVRARRTPKCATCSRHVYKLDETRCFECRRHTVRPATRRPVRMNPIVEDFYFIAADGGVRDPGTRLGYTRETRRLIAARLGVTLASLDRALYRHHTATLQPVSQP